MTDAEQPGFFWHETRHELPPEDEPVLFYTGGIVAIGRYYPAGTRPWRFEGHETKHAPDYWCPIPPPPY